MPDKNKLYHFTFIENIESILENGLLPKQQKGLMSKSDGLVYLTDSQKYIKIMARDIAEVDEYAVITVDTLDVQLSPVWWKGKGYHEWTTSAVEPSKILSVRVVKIRTAKAQMQPRLENK